MRKLEAARNCFKVRPDNRSRTRTSVAFVAGIVSLMSADLAFAQEESDLARANREIANPLTNNTLFIFESDTFRLRGDITDDDKWGNVTIIEPLIPFAIGDTGWTYIMRPIVPLAFSVDTPEAGPSGVSFDSNSGLGDIGLLNLFTPGMNAKGFQWGIGATVQAPTATDDALGSEKWTIGPSAILVKNTSLLRPRDFTMGLLMQNFFSFAGDDDREDVDRTTLQYFGTWSITDQWGLLTAPTIVWDRTRDDEWSVPVGMGVSYTTRLGSKGIPTRFVLEGQYFVERPDDFSADWNIRFAMAMFLPKGGR